MTETANGAAAKTSKKAAGLRLQRVFTTEGVHPYDQVEWERRDVVMTNWRDGTINFEQRGVEFPASWSVNATNIVTTKYFRGAVGTEAREWSLKQVVDRVVETYTKAGVDNGYFATPADAEIFEHELKHMLVHQVFSFNSPVWFNVGTTAPQQVSACQPYDALVATPAGLVPIGRLVESDAVGTKVYDAVGLTRILATKRNGTKDVLRVHTKAGYALDVTADHLVWRASGYDSGAFVEAGELKAGDRLEWHRRDAWGEREFDPREAAEAALAGWLQSDGFVGQYDHGTNRSLTVEAITVNDAELAWVTEALDSVFGDAHRHEREVVTQDESLDCRRTRLYGEHLRPFVERWGLLARDRDAVVPEQLFTAPQPVVAAYLRSVFQAEGFVSARERSTVVEVDMVSEALVRGLQSLLLRFGIFARVGFKKDERPAREGGIWSLRIQNDGDRGIFDSEIGFVDDRKTEKLLRGFDLPGQPARPTKLLEIARVEPLGAMPVYDIQTESGEYLSGNLRVHNCFILAVDDQMDSILNWYKEEGIIFKGGSGAGLNLSRIRSSKELLSSGGTASGPVSFMRGADASAGTIKSGGATRRAAKMVILDVDHPDIEEFIETKAREEDKIRVLRDAGFDMDLGGRDIVSVQYQNANNSVRVTDEFMRAVEAGTEFGLKARKTGDVIDTVDAKTLYRKIATAAWECADPGIQYDDTINDWHTCPETGRITASNPCSEYMHLDNSSCNLASLNLMKFLREDGTFDAKTFAKVVEYVITAMDISICFADFPTEKIGETTRAYRQLGIGYANLGALLMANGLPYDSDSGRAMAGAITSLMQATAYKRSAELAGIVGPYDGYARNADAHQRVIRKHAAANDGLRPFGADDARILHEATRAWQEGQKTGLANGYRNSQASVIAPTGCLTGDTLVTTDRGLSRLDQLGDVHGAQWQDTAFSVSTDEGPRRATKFFVNGEEPTRRIVTEGGYAIQGTLAHRIKVVDPASGAWEWKRLADVTAGDVLPVQMDTLVGGPRRVPLPVLDQAYYAGDRSVVVPDAVDADLAELVGYFMGDGSLHAKGIRLCVADGDLDVVERLRVLAKGLFGIEPAVTAKEGYQEVALQSVRLARWWQAAGFAKTLPADDHVGKGWVPRVPAAVLESNDKAVYAAFLRGLFEADGTVADGVPSVSTAQRAFAAEVQSLLLTLALPSTLRTTPSGFGVECFQVRVRNVELAVVYGDIVGFLGERKGRLLATAASVVQTGNRDRVLLPRAVWDELVPVGHERRDVVVHDLARTGGVPRSVAEALDRQTRDARLRHALDYVFEAVAANEDGGIQPTYDLSVPDNVTYVANGFVSHNTIGLMMDCDTTGLEPDLALVKNKKLVGGASMKIVNGTVPAALRKLGYDEEIVEAIVEYVAEHGHVVDAPGLRPEHYAVFDCAMGERSISWMGHIRMMAAIQPFISGALSKTVNLPETATVEDIEKAYFEGWKLGLKAIAVYRNNCKVGQPLSDINDTKKAAAARTAAMEPHEQRPVRRRLPRRRPSHTVSFSVGGAEGYMTAGSYPDDGLGEVFIKMSKQGSTLAGVMDAFSVAISIGLQYGVPLEAFVSKFANMRFDPAGLTDDPDVRMAQSVMDYIFRRLALDFLPYDKRAELGIFTAEERAATVASSYGAAAVDADVDVEGLAQSVPVEPEPSPALRTSPAGGGGGIGVSAQTAQDAPLCMNCGIKMRPAGSCYVCESCGSTSGCS